MVHEGGCFRRAGFVLQKLRLSRLSRDAFVLHQLLPQAPLLVQDLPEPFQALYSPRLRPNEGKEL